MERSLEVDLEVHLEVHLEVELEVDLDLDLEVDLQQAPFQSMVRALCEPWNGRVQASDRAPGQRRVLRGQHDGRGMNAHPDETQHRPTAARRQLRMIVHAPAALPLGRTSIQHSHNAGCIGSRCLFKSILDSVIFWEGCL